MRKKSFVLGLNDSVVAALPLLSALLGVFVIGFVVGTGGSPAIGQPSQRSPLTIPELATVQLFERTVPSIVNIQTFTREYVPTGRMMAREQEIRGGGSGFVWDRDGHIVTNFHVIGKYSFRRGRAVVDLADVVRVALHDGTVRNATVIGYYIDRDIAVLRIDTGGLELKPISIGSSDGLRVGQDVLAIGNPFGLDSTLTKGIISALGRSIKALSDAEIYDVIQTDAAINPGNSGGPLIDSAGRLIGINTQIKSRTRSSAGIGFAIPVDVLSAVVPQLLRSGKVEWPTMGILTIRDEIARRTGIRRGVIVRSVFPGTGAAQAGIEGVIEREDGAIIQDVIVAIDEKPVTNVNELQRLLRDYRRGDRVRVTIARNGKTRDVTVELGAEPAE